MQPEGLIEHDHLLLRNADARPQPVIIRLAVRDHHVQPIDGAALKYHHQHLALRARRCRLRMQGTGQKCWNHRSADERKGTMTKKDTPGQGHGKKLLCPSLTRYPCEKLRISAAILAHKWKKCARLPWPRAAYRDGCATTSPRGVGRKITDKTPSACRRWAI